METVELDPCELELDEAGLLRAFDSQSIAAFVEDDRPTLRDACGVSPESGRRS
jgi:hypothetical protein